MSFKLIVFPNGVGGISISYPTTEALAVLSIDQIAQQIVPSGVPYRIADINEFHLDGTFNEEGIPNIDKTFRAAFQVEEVDLCHGVGGDFNCWIEQDGSLVPHKA